MIFLKHSLLSLLLTVKLGNYILGVDRSTTRHPSGHTTNSSLDPNIKDNPPPQKKQLFVGFLGNFGDFFCSLIQFT